jgi:tellurite resistance-related uncharacterized protein
MDKISALKITKEKLNDKIKSFETLIYSEKQSDKLFFDEEIIHRCSNDESSAIMLRIKAGQKTSQLVEEEFKRIVVLKGKIKIHIPSYKNDEDFILNSPNTLLIPPKTVYSMEIIEDTEIINVYKPKKDFFVNKIQCE